MAKDRVCGMNVDELKTQYISEINGEKVFMSWSISKKIWPKILKKYGFDKYCKCYSICYLFSYTIFTCITSNWATSILPWVCNNKIINYFFDCS